ALHRLGARLCAKHLVRNRVPWRRVAFDDRNDLELVAICHRHRQHGTLSIHQFLGRDRKFARVLTHIACTCPGADEQYERRQHLRTPYSLHCCWVGMWCVEGGTLSAALGNSISASGCLMSS